MRRLASHVMVILLLASSLTAAGLPSPASAASCGATTVNGSGTSGDPFLVTNAAELAAIGSGACTLSSHYRQTVDIALTGSWTPIGTSGSPFTGSYDGNSQTISGMYITGGGILGMFGELDGASVNDLTLNGTVDASGGEIGMLAGRAIDSEIAFVFVTATVETSGSFVGGLVGYADGITVSDSSVAGSVGALFGGDTAGGLIGSAAGLISLTDSDNDATVTGDEKVGGIIGATDYSATSTVLALTRVDNTGAVSGTEHVGGLVGEHTWQSDTMTSLDNSGDVTGVSDGIGGLIGRSEKEILLTNSSNSGNVSGAADVGGFIGSHDDEDVTIQNGVNSGVITASASDRSGVGGFVGQQESGDLYFIDSTNSGTVSGAGDDVGGLVGDVDEEDLYVTRSTNSASVTGGDGYVGGLSGYVSGYAIVTSSANSGDITGATSVGGLIGEAGDPSEVTGSSNSGDVFGTSPSTTRVGGLIGRVRDDLALNRSWSTGALSGPSQIGGLIGSVSSGNEVTIRASFARGAVTATAATSQVGGLVGTGTDFTIENSYSAGVVSATGSRAGGLVGDATNPALTNSYSSASVTAGSSADPLTGQVMGTPTVTATFWSSATSGLSSGAVGTDVDLTDLASFTGWNIVDGWVPYVDSTSIADSTPVWGLCSAVNSGRPFLLWEYDTDPCSSPDDGDEGYERPPAGLVVLAGGADHDEAMGAVAVSRLLDSAPIVFLVARTALADAVVAATYGGGAGGPVLVTDTDQVPSSTLDEIERLGARRVVVIGGPERVSNTVLAQLHNDLPSVAVDRVAGVDRVGTAVEASRRRFPSGTTTAYVAAADAPADALITAAQASPVLFSFRSTVPQATMTELTRLSPEHIVIVGGSARVDQMVMAALTDAFPTVSVSRSGGANRYETAAMFTRPWQRQVLLVDGRLDRVDSIAAAATAAVRNTAMLFTERTCAPPATHRFLTGRRVLTLGSLGTQACE